MSWDTPDQKQQEAVVDTSPAASASAASGGYGGGDATAYHGSGDGSHDAVTQP